MTATPSSSNRSRRRRTVGPTGSKIPTRSGRSRRNSLCRGPFFPQRCPPETCGVFTAGGLEGDGAAADGCLGIMKLSSPLLYTAVIAASFPCCGRRLEARLCHGLIPSSLSLSVALSRSLSLLVCDCKRIRATHTRTHTRRPLTLC